MASQQEVSLLAEYESSVLDIHYKTYPLWSRKRGEATFAALVQYDLGSIEDMQRMPLVLARSVASAQEIKNREEGLGQALRWLTDDGAKLECTDVLSRRLLNEARDFCRFAGTYVDLADFHRMFRRGQVDITVDPEDRCIKFLWPEHTHFADIVLCGTEPRGWQTRKGLAAAERWKNRDVISLLRPLQPAVIHGLMVLKELTSKNIAPFIELIASLELDEYDFIKDDANIADVSASEVRTFFHAFKGW